MSVALPSPSVKDEETEEGQRGDPLDGTASPWDSQDPSQPLRLCPSAHWASWRKRSREGSHSGREEPPATGVLMDDRTRHAFSGLLLIFHS